SAGALISTATSKDTRNYRGDPLGTCRTSTSPLYPGRLALDGPDNSRIIEPGARPDPNRVSIGAAHVSSLFPTYVAAPFISHGDHGQSLIPCPSGTDCYRRDQGTNLPNRGAPADRREDRWRALICRGADEGGARIRHAAGRRWALR